VYLDHLGPLSRPSHVSRRATKCDAKCDISRSHFATNEPWPGGCHAVLGRRSSGWGTFHWSLGAYLATQAGPSPLDKQHFMHTSPEHCGGHISRHQCPHVLRRALSWRFAPACTQSLHFSFPFLEFHSMHAFLPTPLDKKSSMCDAVSHSLHITTTNAIGRRNRRARR